MTPGGISPERRESNNSTRSNRSYAIGGMGQQQQSRSSGSDVILADNNSDTFGPGGELHVHSRYFEILFCSYTRVRDIIEERYNGTVYTTIVVKKT
jgi:hypothetical protein